MRKQIQIVVFATLVVILGNTPGEADNLLFSGDFEPLGGEVPEWIMEEFATSSGTAINAGELIGFAANTGTQGLWLRVFAGGQDPGPDNLTNAILLQTVPGVVGEVYTFSGFSKWETNYSGGVTTLTGEPLNGQTSPTQTNLELAFLGTGGTVIGVPETLDLRTEQDNSGFWMQHSIVGQAPAGTASIRVTAEVRDMVFNAEPEQSACYDPFSLTGDSEPWVELLANPDLEDPPGVPLDDWTITVDDPENPGNNEIIRADGIAIFQYCRRRM